MPEHPETTHTHTHTLGLTVSVQHIDSKSWTHDYRRGIKSTQFILSVLYVNTVLTVCIVGLLLEPFEYLMKSRDLPSGTENITQENCTIMSYLSTLTKIVKH